MPSPRPQAQRGLSSLAARAAAAAAAVGDDSAVRAPEAAGSTPRPAHTRRQSSADFGAFVGSSSALDWGFDGGSSSSALPSSAAAPTSQPDWSAWDSLASSSTATPLPSTAAPNSGGLGFNAADDAFFAAFEQATLSSSTAAGAAAAGKGRESPPIIDLRPTERKLAAQAAARSPRASSTGGSAPHSRQAEEDFFAAFERAPEETLRRLPKPPALMGDDLEAMTDARLSPMAIPVSPRTARQEYFSAGPAAAQEREKQGQQEEEQGWTGSLKRTWGSLRGLPAGLVEHLPSVADFVVPPGEGSSSSSEEDDVRRDAGNVGQRPGTNGAGGKERRPSSSSTNSSASAPRRGLAHAADYSSSTPFGNSSSSGAASAPRRGSTLGSTSGATLSGAPGFAAGAPQRWNTGSWSLPAASPSATRQPIPVTLVGRAEESETCITHWHASRLQAHLPPRSQLGKTWKLLYNLDQHGISLQTLYANVASGLSSSGAGRVDNEEMKEGWLRGASREARAALGESRRVGGGLELKDAGIVVAVIDSRENVFGAYLNERLRAQSSYYGSGECFLWKTTRGASSTADDGIKVFRWTGRNDYVALTEHSYLSFGGGDGRYGLWLDGRLEHGVSARCPAFDNDVLSDGDAGANTEADAKEERFEVLCVEVWAVGID